MFDTVLGLGASLVGEPAVAAVEALGRDDVLVASFDLSAGFLEAVVDGKAAFAIDQQQFLQVTKFFLQWLVLSTALQVQTRNHSLKLVRA